VRQLPGRFSAGPAVDGITLALGAALIGIAIGLVGIGGVFLIPLLTGAGLPLEDAIGTSLLTFTATGIVATAIYGRRGSIDWRSAAYTSLGSIVGGPLGARLSVWLPAGAVTMCFAFLLIVTGAATLRRSPATERKAEKHLHLATLLASGVAVGVGSGLTGVGGPALLVPLLLLLGVSSSAAIGISQPNAIAASASGAVGHLMFGKIDVPLACSLGVVAGAGVIFGALLHQRFSGDSLRKIVGTACIVLGAWLSFQFIRRLGM